MYTVSRGQQLVRYSSGVVQTSASATALVKAWRNELTTNQGVADAKGTCTILSGLADQRDKPVSSLEQSWKNMKNEVIHIDWKTAPGRIKQWPEGARAERSGLKAERRSGESSALDHFDDSRR